MSEKDYNIEFFRKHYMGSYKSAHVILSYLKQYLPINSLIDFGCGVGTWCVAAAELEIPVIFGIDSHSLPRSQIDNLNINYLQRDFRNAINFHQKFDLAISVEVAEHIPESDSDIYISNIINTSKIILFSAAVPGQEGLNHVNEQLLSYWVKKFHMSHYELVDVLRGQLWDNSDIEIWYRNNIVLFVHESVVTATLNSLPSPKPIVDIIHPMLFERKIKKYKGNL